jgi:hypothetical protein
MRSTRGVALVLATFLSGALAFGGAPARARPPVSAATAAAATDSATFPARAVAELSALRPEVTAAQWLREHQGDSVTAFSFAAAEHNDDRWCLRATRRDRLTGGAAVLRYAYFFPPPPPASLELPPDRDMSNLAVRACILGSIWVETPQPDSVAGHQLAERTREALRNAYGPVAASSDSQKQRLRALPGYGTMSLVGAAAWRAPGRGQDGPVTLVSAFDAASWDVGRRRVLAFAYLPHANFETSQRIRGGVQRDSAQARRTLQIAGGLTGFDARVVRDFLALSGEGGREPERATAIERWLTAARDLAPRQRAAALLVADGVVLKSFRARDTVAGDAYAPLGLEFVHSPLGDAYNYAHSLLQEALRLDSAGPVGELAMITLLDRGFDLTGMCGGGFDAVIKAGEPFLARVQAPARRASVLFHLADAYADVVALAAGAGDEYAHAADFTARAPQARRKAIDFYRQGIALDRGSEQARAAWVEAWRLLAGLPPTQTHFFCVYD